MTGSWKLHVCALDAHCRQHGCPSRVYLATPWGQLDLGIGKDAALQRPDGRWSQVLWSPKARMR